MSRRSYSEDARERLLAFWEADDAVGAPIGCVATTFTLDAAFFEEEVLARFVGIESDPNEDGRAYVIEREDKLSQIFSCVLVDRGRVSSHRSLRWHQLPVGVPGGCVMHAKVTLLVWEHRIRVLVGSANLTKPAYRRNYEHVGALDFEPESELPLDLLGDVIDFLDRLRHLAPGADSDTNDGPQAALSSFLAKTRERMASWTSYGWSRGQPRVAFTPVWPDEVSLFQRLREQFPSSRSAENVWIVSPFYDDGDRARHVVDALVETMGVHGHRVLNFIASGRELNDPQQTVELDLPDTVREPWSRRRHHHFYLVDAVDTSDGEEERRNLHAKSMWLQRGDRALFAMGSSNFTAAGTGSLRGPCNVEANLSYVMLAASSQFARRCEAAYPPYKKIDLEERTVRFLRTDDHTLDANGVTPLPQAFGLALFKPRPEGGSLLLSIASDAPKGFRVFTEGDVLITDQEKWAEIGCPGQVEHDWSERRPPSYLTVRWSQPKGSLCEAIWVVNVTDCAYLPPPEELRALALDELLEILTSARPLHEVVDRVLRRRERQKLASRLRLDIELDPHRKVDTRNFLLRRMRRVSAGLEGLRERLERPAYHVDALRWRLHGPVGPLILARKLAEQEPEAAAFMLAEVALTVRRANWSRVDSLVGSDIVKDEVANVLEELHTMANTLAAPANLAGYVQEAFEEIRR